jgi:hypothetical protein
MQLDSFTPLVHAKQVPNIKVVHIPPTFDTKEELIQLGTFQDYLHEIIQKEISQNKRILMQ